MEGVNIMISARVVADSLSPQNHRLTSLITVMPRMVLAEFNTHRAFSRNSASSRAIPFTKMCRSVEETPFVPMRWMKDHRGMQGTEYFDNNDRYELRKMSSYGATIPMEDKLKEEWLEARNAAVASAKCMHDLGLTKQLVNRVLEPFMYHTVLVTASEWDNFMHLRDHEAAEIHIQAVARAIKQAMLESTPRELKGGEWHIPFGDDFEGIGILSESVTSLEEAKIQVATARCARLSYMTLGDNPKIDYSKDIELHDLLLSQGHMSPFEHCARAMTDVEYRKYTITRPAPLLVPASFTNKLIALENGSIEVQHGWCRNFRGFVQYRAFLD